MSLNIEPSQENLVQELSIDFRLIYDEWIPPGAFALIGHNQFIYSKNGEVTVMSIWELQELMWETY